MITTLGIITPTVAVIGLVIVLVVIGPGKLPELGKSLGRGIKEFKSETKDKEDNEPAMSQVAEADYSIK